MVLISSVQAWFSFSDFRFLRVKSFFMFDFLKARGIQWCVCCGRGCFRKGARSRCVPDQAGIVSLGVWVSDSLVEEERLADILDFGYRASQVECFGKNDLEDLEEVSAIGIRTRQNVRADDGPSAH